MAYFSNGTEGECYREQYCFRCRHYDAADGARECPVWSAHWYFAYGQSSNDKLSSVLSMLIPMEPHTFKDGLTVNVAGQCAMFLARRGAMADTMPTPLNMVRLLLDPHSTRRTIAKRYVKVLQCFHTGRPLDVAGINEAILLCYRPSGLDYIKKLAWAQYLREGRDG